MPYTTKKVGSQYCVYKKENNEKVGCTDGNKEALKKYMAALHINAKESVIREYIKKEIKSLMEKSATKRADY
jgi:hypothetical protein